MLDKLLGLILKMGYFCAVGDGSVNTETVPVNFPLDGRGETEG